MNIITDERCTGYRAMGHPERPARISMTLERLKKNTTLDLAWLEPLPVTQAQLELAHHPAHIQAVCEAAGAFDGDTPAYPNIYEHACRSAGAALQAMENALQGQMSFSLIRPPGHHATHNQAMGFCYFNSIAIAVLAALSKDIRKVAVYDFDVHHGNGTEDILLNRPNTAFFSIHQFPCYPGTGGIHRGKNCFNFPVEPNLARLKYRKRLEEALEELQTFQPELVGISAGFDAFAGDPLAQGTLEKEDYYWLGTRLRELGIPVFSVLEGGYSDELPALIEAYLEGLQGAPQSPSN